MAARLLEIFVLISVTSTSANRASTAKTDQLFTTNAACARTNCVNPIFPGLEDLHRLEKAAWFATTLSSISSSMSFCRGAINYNPSLPAFNNFGAWTSASVATATKDQDSAAMTMFFYHLAGLGYEAWDFPRPGESDDECVKATWRMVCFTYFPRAQVGLIENTPSPYLRPCHSSCQNYVRQCQVECCDESVQCVFSHTKALSATEVVTTSGYIPHDGPSSLCTGGAQRRSGQPAKSGLFLGSIFLAAQAIWAGGEATLGSLMPRLGRRTLSILGVSALALVLQGCDDVPTHEVANWRGEPDYLIRHQFIPPGASSRNAVLNSCAVERLAATLQCNGRGTCKIFDTKRSINPTTFCECDRDWADPECGTRRKSQSVAFTFAVLGGPFGLDQFYLGAGTKGLLKLLTFGGFGLWWIADIISIGSSPVLTGNFRVAQDLPHWVFVLSTVWLALFIGFVISYYGAIEHRNDRRRKALMMQAEEDALARGSMPYKAEYESSSKDRSLAFKPAQGSAYGALARNA